MSHIDQQPGAHSLECTTCKHFLSGDNIPQDTITLFLTKHDGHDIIEHHATPEQDGQ